MRYEIEIPAELEQSLRERATESGQDLDSLVRKALERIALAPIPANGPWTEQGEERRCELIDKDILGTITESEKDELAGLDRLAHEHFDRVAPPPMDAARQLRQQLQDRMNRS